jgi:hypothetical protein
VAKGKHLSQSVQKEEILRRIHKQLIFLYGRGKGDHSFEKIVSLLLDFKVDALVKSRKSCHCERSEASSCFVTTCIY